MKAISIIQPWASLIVLGHKGIENRTWPTRYRGRLLIHSSKRGYDATAETLCQSLGLELPADLPRGQILGEVQLSDCVEMRSMGFSELGPWAFGPWCWVLTSVMRYETPLACRGSLGLWTPPAEILEAGSRSDVLHQAATGRQSETTRSDDQLRLF